MLKKCLILGDLHGKKPKVFFNNYDLIITTGDFCSDSLRKYMFKAIKIKSKEHDSKIKWYDLIGKRKARRMIRKSISDGRSILKYLNSLKVPVYIIPGNWDWYKEKNSDWFFLKKNHYKTLFKYLGNIYDVHNKLLNVGNYNIIGYGNSSGPEYPQYKEDLETFKNKELRKLKNHYKRDLEKISSLFEKATKPVIFLSHNVPFNTPLDLIRNKNSPKYGYHYGSLIVREIVEKYQPLVNIGGHIHENLGKYKIKNTMCINAGFSSNTNIVMEMRGEKITKIKFNRNSKLKN